MECIRNYRNRIPKGLPSFLHLVIMTVVVVVIEVIFHVKQSLIGYCCYCEFQFSQASTVANWDCLAGWGIIQRDCLFKVPQIAQNDDQTMNFVN